MTLIAQALEIQIHISKLRIIQYRLYMVYYVYRLDDVVR
jgi:hypothetical protein